MPFVAKFFVEIWQRIRGCQSYARLGLHWPPTVKRRIFSSTWNLYSFFSCRHILQTLSSHIDSRYMYSKYFGRYLRKGWTSQIYNNGLTLAPQQKWVFTFSVIIWLIFTVNNKMKWEPDLALDYLNLGPYRDLGLDPDLDRDLDKNFAQNLDPDLDPDLNRHWDRNRCLDLNRDRVQNLIKRTSGRYHQRPTKNSERSREQIIPRKVLANCKNFPTGRL